jgi:hypothetical protein
MPISIGERAIIAVIGGIPLPMAAKIIVDTVFG